MNIFVLSKCPRKAARQQCEKHVIKMILETAQLLCTAHHESAGGLPAPYKSTHKNHPCALWARASAANYDWLVEHGLELCSEYTRRYGKVHKTEQHLEWLARFRPDLPDLGLTPFALCMPEAYRVEGKPVRSYRNYYIHDKRNMATWDKLDNMPKWFKEGVAALELRD